MRTFALKQKSFQKSKAAGSAGPLPAFFGQSTKVKSIVRPQRSGRHRVVQQLQRPNADAVQAGVAGTSSTHSGHDFSRIPVHHRSPASIQAKLKVSSPGDIYEQEADRVSAQIMRMPEPQPQHACPCGGECPRCKTKQPAQEQKRLQNKNSLSSGFQQTRAPRVVNEALRSDGQPLDARTRDFFEAQFGQDFGATRIHIGSQATAAARSLNARAFTLREDIVFDRGEYSPGTRQGRQLLAHELVHVVQQTGARDPGPVQTPDTSTAAIPTAASARAGLNDPSVTHAPRVFLSAPAMVARGEKWDAFWGVGPFDAMKAKELADKALIAAQQTGLPGLHNGPGDAWRHCYWNCLMTDEIGRDQAKFVAENHEKHGGGPAVENLMDSRNNWEGRECGGSDCDTCCQTKLDTGVLDVIEGGKMVPSKPTPRTGGKQSDKYEY